MVGFSIQLWDLKDAILYDVQVATKKLTIVGKIKIGRIYVKKVNEEIIVFVTNYTSKYPRYTGWTLYKTEKIQGEIVYTKKE